MTLIRREKRSLERKKKKAGTENGKSQEISL